MKVIEMKSVKMSYKQGQFMCVTAQNQISRVLHKGHLRKSNDGERAVF